VLRPQFCHRAPPLLQRSSPPPPPESSTIQSPCPCGPSGKCPNQNPRQSRPPQSPAPHPRQTFPDRQSQAIAARVPLQIAPPPPRPCANHARTLSPSFLSRPATTAPPSPPWVHAV